MTINQSSTHGIIDWHSFSIGSGNLVQFNNGSGATLNRVTGGNLSQIEGNLSATGSVYLINPQGIVIGPGSKIVTNGSFVASTRDVSNGAFLQGGPMTASGTSNGDVVNAGVITSKTGNAILVGRSVSNSGTISAPSGRATLAAGNEILLQPVDGDSRIAVSGGSGDVTNSGAVKAAQVQLDAAGGNVYALAGNSGVVNATGAGTINGHVWLTAGGTTAVSGTVSATNADGTGGSVTVDGGSVALTGAHVTANGNNGGGTISVGGWSTNSVTADADTRLEASAARSGNGGSVSVIAQTTAFHGSVSARGGSQSGNGGTIETSGHVLDVGGARIDTSALHGLTGNWTLDPYDVTISNDPTSGGSFDGGSPTNSYTPSATSNVSVSDLEGSLASTNVTVTTGASGSDAGDITVVDPVTWSSAHTLTLVAANNIDIDAAITATHGGLSLNAANAIGATDAVNVGSFVLQSGAWSQNTAALPAFTASNFTIGGGTFLRVAGGDGSSGNPYQIADIYGFQGINSSTALLSADYALVNNIDASVTSGWNAGAGLVPLGTDGAGNISNAGHGFGGIFDGPRTYGLEPDGRHRLELSRPVRLFARHDPQCRRRRRLGQWRRWRRRSGGRQRRAQSRMPMPPIPSTASAPSGPGWVQ